MATTHRLYRSNKDRMITGVSGGLAEYFDVDPVLVRIGWVVFCFASGGTAILIYIIMAIIMPKEENLERLSDELPEAGGRIGTEKRPRNLLALILIGIGVLALLPNVSVFSWFGWGVFSWLSWSVLWPMVLVAIGAAILMSRTKRA